MITIGTRGSKLALVQAHWVASVLNKHGLENRIQIIKTKGDVVQDRFDKIEGKGFFTREIEDELHRGGIDIAVHCLKDLPTSMPEGLRIAAITEREVPFDVLVSTEPFSFTQDGYPDLSGKVVGTSSNRRVAGLAHYFPDASFVPLRGNVPTRVEKLQRGDAEVIVLAAAGINRLSMGMDDLFVFQATPPLLIPAPGQGALAIQVRDDFDQDLSFFHHETTAACVNGERRILSRLEGGCQLPLGVYISDRGGDIFHLELFLGSPLDESGKSDGESMHLSLNGSNANALVEEACEHLRQKGFLKA